MANKHNTETKYRIKTYSKTDSVEATKEIQLVDAAQSPFISYDELLRCFTEILTNTNPDTEDTAIKNLLANEDDINNIINQK